MNQQSTDPIVPVLIVGGGVVGLSAALFLLHQGIRPLLIEKHRGTSIHPRARGFDIRTMELYREIQVGEVIREAGAALAPSWGIHTSDSMAAALRKKKPGERKSPEKAMGIEGLVSLSPETGARCTQDLSEPVLLTAARERGADIRYATELMSFTQGEQEVMARIVDRATGEEQVIRAAYLLAADGARSPVRETLRAATVGRGALSDLLNIYFEADLSTMVRGREFSIILIRRPGLRGMLASINNSDRWVFHLYYDKARGEKETDFTTERITAILREVIGLPDVGIRVISVLPWQPTIKVVKEMQSGRVFLAGDAAHVMTPYGGKGANTGIQDAHNLAWKLAAVLKGEAHPSLLHTYNTERQPIGLFNALRSGEWADQYGLLTKKPSMILGLVGAVLSARLAALLGMRKLSLRITWRGVAGTVGLPDYKYRSAAIADQEGGGTRAPHCWVSHRGQRVSTLDLLGTGWVLLTGRDNKDWKDGAATLETRAGRVLAVYSFGPSADLDYQERTIEDIFGISDSGAMLIRPDGFVAWKSKGPAVDPPALLENLMRKLSGFV